MVLSSSNATSYIPFSQLVRFGICICIVAVIVLALLQYGFGYTFHADATTYCLLVILGFVMHSAVRSYRVPEQTILYVIVILTAALVFLQRIVILLIVPDSFGIRGPDMKPVVMYSVKELNWTIFAFSILLVTILASIDLACRVRMPTPEKNRSVSAYRRGRVLLYVGLLLTAVASPIISTLLGWKMGTKWESGWIVRMIPTSFFLFAVVLTWFRYPDVLGRGEKTFILACSFLYVASSLVAGSRSGLLSVAMIVIIVGLVTRVHFQMPKRWVWICVPLLCVVGMVVWIGGTAIRYNNKLQFDVITHYPLISVLEITRRFGGPTQNMIIFINDWCDETAVNETMSLGGIIAAGVNSFVPGNVCNTPFESLGGLWMRLAWPDYYRSFGIHGEQWFIFGQFYLLYGFAGMIICTGFFFFGSTLLFTYFRSRNTFPSLLAACLTASVLFKGVMEGINLDQVVSAVLYNASYLVFFYIGCSMINDPIFLKKRAFCDSRQLSYVEIGVQRTS